MPETLFHLADMCCPTEQALVRGCLDRLPGVEALEFNTLAREVKVTHQLADSAVLLRALQTLHLGVSEKGSSKEVAAAPRRGGWEWVALSGILALGAEGAAWTTGTDDTLPVALLAVASMTVGGTATLRKGLIALRSFTLNINFLMTLAVIGAMILGQWPEAAMVMFLFALAERCEEYSLDRARDAIGALVKLKPETALVKTCCGDWKEVPAGSVKVGQVVRVRAEDLVPLDGEVISGTSSVNQAPITGESWPVKKEPGAKVFAGTINGPGALEITVTANSEGTTLARIIRAVQRAQSERSPTQRLVDKFAATYTPLVVLLAALTAVVPPLVTGGSFAEWFYSALVILVISCPCALVLSTPVTVMSGLAVAARLGILVKGGGVLEEGRRLKALALDKTGTLTEGTPSITRILLAQEQSEARALHLAASLNAHSRHPIASSFAALWAKVGQKPLLAVDSFESLTGRGVAGQIDGSPYWLGGRRLAQERGLLDDLTEQRFVSLEAEGLTPVALFSDSAAQAVFGVMDSIRSTSVEAIAWLHRLEVKTLILSGDNVAIVDRVARQAGVDEARGNLLPEDKLSLLEDLLVRYGCAGMVGDGVNDSPALAKASIGFAMGEAGTELAVETADVTLMNDDLRKIPFFLELSRATARILKQNIAFALLIKLVFLSLALFGHATLWMAVVADMGGSLLVIFNGLRVLRFRPRQGTLKHVPDKLEPAAQVRLDAAAPSCACCRGNGT